MAFVFLGCGPVFTLVQGRRFLSRFYLIRLLTVALGLCLRWLLSGVGLARGWFPCGCYVLVRWKTPLFFSFFCGIARGLICLMGRDSHFGSVALYSFWSLGCSCIGTVGLGFPSLVVAVMSDDCEHLCGCSFADSGCYWTVCSFQLILIRVYNLWAFSTCYF